MRPLVLSMLVALTLAQPVFSQEIVAKTTVAGKSVVLYDDGGWAYGPTEESWCTTFDAGIDLCLPTTWARIPNPDANSHGLLLRADGLQAEVWHIWPRPNLGQSMDRITEMQAYLLDVLSDTPSTSYATKTTCGGCVATAWAIFDQDGSQTLTSIVGLPFSSVSITVTSTRPDVSAEDLTKVDALSAGITVNPSVYDKAFRDGE